MSRDIGQYSNSIQFETEVYDGAYWVPINTLGASRYSSEEMLEISKLPIEKRKERTDENGAMFYVPREDDPMVLYSSGQSDCDISFVDFKEPKE